MAVQQDKLAGVSPFGIAVLAWVATLACVTLLVAAFLPGLAHWAVSGIQIAAAVSILLALRALWLALRQPGAPPHSVTQAHALLEQTTDIIALLQPDGRIGFASPALERALGLPLSALIGRDLFDLVWPDDVPRARRELGKVLEGPDAIVHTRLRFRHSDGTPRWLEGTGRNRSNDPSLRGVVIAGRDVTGQRDEEMRLRTLTRAIEQSPTSIVITDRSGAIEYVNPKFCAVTGYSADEVLGKNPRLLKSGETPSEIYAQLWKAILGGHEWRGELHNRRKDGTLYWESASISPVVDEQGNLAHFVAVKEDITHRKRTEAALHESQELFEQVFMSAPIGIAVADTEFRWLKVNHALASMLGYAPEELIGKSFKDITYPPDLEASTVRARALMAGAIVPYALEKRYVHKNGSLLWVQVHVAMVRDATGAPVCYAATVLDIGARKEAQEALEHWARELEDSNRALRHEREIRERTECELKARRPPDLGDATSRPAA